VNQFGQGLLTIFAGVITVAIISVIVGRNSQAPAAITDTGSALAKIIAAAVSPQGAATNGNLGASTFSTGSNGLTLV
jgi:hypothetical protein